MNIQQTASTPKLVTMIPADPQMTERDIRNNLPWNIRSGTCRNASWSCSN